MEAAASTVLSPKEVGSFAQSCGAVFSSPAPQMPSPAMLTPVSYTEATGGVGGVTTAGQPPPSALMHVMPSAHMPLPHTGPARHVPEAAQLLSLQELDSALNAISGPENSELWTNAAFINDRQWDKIRSLAENVLLEFGW